MDKGWLCTDRPRQHKEKEKPKGGVGRHGDDDDVSRDLGHAPWTQSPQKALELGRKKLVQMDKGRCLRTF